jgi:hypothetical protein
MMTRRSDIEWLEEVAAGQWITGSLYEQDDDLRAAAKAGADALKVLGGVKPSHLHCNECGKQVSSGLFPLPVPEFEGLVVRAWIQCPECIETAAQRVMQYLDTEGESK